MPTLGEILPRLLEAHGFDTIFGIPGVHTVEMYRGLPATRLRHVTPRHEQGAGFMADGHARASGRPAACFIISGPGMTNIATAMGQAHADSVPMLVVSSVSNRRELARGEGRLHEMKDQGALVSGVAAFSHTVMSPDELPAVLDRAAAVFRAARPRPVHVELPLDVITAEAGHVALRAGAVPARPVPDAGAVEAAAAMLRAARAPLVVLGGGCVDAGPALGRMVARLGAPVVLTINAKGLLPPDHPALVGSLLPQGPVLDALADADVVLAVGTELGETDTLLFGTAPTISGRLIRVDIDPAQIGCNATADLGIVSDAGAFCAALAARLEGHAPAPAAAARLRARALADIPAPYRLHGRIMARIAERWPDVVVAGDSTQPVYGANLTYDAPAPRGWFNSSTGFGTLGYGLPAAIGAKIACPDRPVIALTGDGGLQFTLPEIATAVEQRLPLPIILWNNRGYGEIRTYMRDRAIPEIGVDIHTPDFQMLARGFGAHAVAVDGFSALIAALERAFAADRPTLIEIDETTAAEWRE